jgi:hypothetical protein
MLIGLALLLMLCISPVAAVSGGGFEIVIDDSGDIPTYKYYNKYTPWEKYFKIHTDGTNVLNSLVTFKPANIPDAPTMVVDTFRKSSDIYLPYHSVDDWEIKYYSHFGRISQDMDFLKNAGVMNLMVFGDHIWDSLVLELSKDQYFKTYYQYKVGHKFVTYYYYIPEWSFSDTVAD